MNVDALPTIGCGGVMDLLFQVKDPRNAKGRRYPAHSLLAICIGAILSGAKSICAIADWARLRSDCELFRLGILGNPPKETAIRRFLAKLNHHEFESILSQWLMHLNGTFTGKAIAVDGKALRGAKTHLDLVPMLISAVLHEDGITVAQVDVEKGTNEIKAIIPLFEKIDITGSVITVDAMHTQKETARYLTEEKRAHYLMTVKGNQAELKNYIETNSKLSYSPVFTHIDKGHGRLETRSIRAVSILDDDVSFPSAKQIFQIERERILLATGSMSHEVIYGITSLTAGEADGPNLLALNRGHWRIENSSHYVRDVTFFEDYSRIRSAVSPFIMAMMRNLAINIFRIAGATNIAAAIRFCAY